MRVQVQVPVRLIVEPGALRGDALGDLEAKLVAELQQAWLTAQREVAADGFSGTPRLRPTSFDWNGPGRRALDEPERRRVERRLLAVIRGASATVLAALPTRAWQIHPPLHFRPRFDKFVDFVRPWWHASYRHELKARTGEHYTDEVKATAWVIDVKQDVPLPEFLPDVAAGRLATLGAGPFLLFRNRKAARELRALDPRRLAALPTLQSDEPVIAAGLKQEDVILRTGMRLVFAAAAEPAASTVPVADFAPPFDVVVIYGELFTVNLPPAEGLQQKYGAFKWDVFLDMFWEWPVTVRVQPFTMNREAHGSVVRRLVVERAQQDEPNAELFGRLVRVGQDDLLGLLPEGVANRANAWATTVTPAPPPEAKPATGSKTKPAKKTAAAATTGPAPFAPDWKPGERGLLATPILDSIGDRILAANQAESLRDEARRLAHILLNVKDDFWGADKLRALEKFLLAWRSERPKPVMEVVFEELDRLHAFTELYDLLYRKYSLYGWMRVAVIGNVTGTRFEQRPEVQRLVAMMNVIRREIMTMITWDHLTNDLVFVHSGKRLKAAGLNNPNPNAGVIGWVEPYFSSKGVISRPTKATMEKLAEPTRKKIQALMLAMMCGKGETRTREQLIAEAVEAAAKELNLDPEKDFERVEARFSFRVITVERQIEHGLEMIYVTLQPVHKIGDDNWEDAGPAKAPMTLAALDAELVSIHVDHEIAALTVLFMVEALLLGGGYVIIAGGWAGAAGLVIAISIREIIYIWTTAEADRDLNGYLTQALYGVMDVIGFRLGALAATKIAGRIVTGQVLKQATTKWLIYASKGLAASTALGTTMVVEKFADDLFHLSHCRRWSSPGDYLKEFGTGFAIGLTFEFAIAPALSVAGRGLVRALAGSKTGAREVAEVLVKDMRPSEIAEVAEQGAKKLEEALLNTFKAEKVGLVKQIMTAIRQEIDNVVEHARVLKEPKGLLPKLRAEWTSRATKDLFEAAKLPLGKNALTGVEILVRTATREEMNVIIENMLRSARLRGLLEASPKLGAELFTRGFKGAPEELDRFLALLEKLPAAEADRVLVAVARIGAGDTAEAVTASGKTIEALLELVGQKAEAAEALAKYSKEIVSKKFTALTKQDFANSLTRQKEIYSDALRLQARQQTLADDVMAQVGTQRGTAKSILKRDDLGEFVDGVLGKMTRNKYTKVAEMNDMVRGRFDMADEDAVRAAAQALQAQKTFKIHVDAKGKLGYEAPRVAASGKVRYPRYHVILEDVATGMTHEWQVGTRAATTLYETGGIKIPKDLAQAAKKLNKHFKPDLHDIEFDLFQAINKKHPKIAAKHGLPAFIEEVVEASDRAVVGDAFVELEKTIARLHERAGKLLEQLVDDQGGEWVAQFFH